MKGKNILKLCEAEAIVMAQEYIDKRIKDPPTVKSIDVQTSGVANWIFEIVLEGTVAKELGSKPPVIV